MVTFSDKFIPKPLTPLFKIYKKSKEIIGVKAHI